jgi:hypothetical protein
VRKAYIIAPQLVSCRFILLRSRPLIMQLLTQPRIVLLLCLGVFGAPFTLMQLLAQLPDFVLLLTRRFFCLLLGFLQSNMKAAETAAVGSAAAVT